MSETKTIVTTKTKFQEHDEEREDKAFDVSAEVSLSPRNPIPLELENIMGFSPGGNKYIPFFNTEDDTYEFNGFFVNILQSVLQSTTLNACILSKTKCAMGDGLEIEGLKPGADKVWDNFSKNCNADGESLNTVIEQAIKSFYVFGNVCIEFVKGSVGGKKFLYVYCKNTLDCRKGWPDENNNSNAVVISRWFRKPDRYNMTQKFNIRIPFYHTGPGSKKQYWVEDTIAKTQPDKEPNIYMGGKPSGVGIGVYRTTVWIKDNYPGYDHYGLPSWLSAKIDSMNEYNSKHYNLDNLDNNMSPGGLMTLSGNLTDEEVRKKGKQLNRAYTGKGKIGRLMVIASEGGAADAKFTPFNTFKEGSYVDLIKESKEQIILANEWDGALIGIGDKGTMGKGGAYLKELYQQKVRTVVKPLHRKMKDEFLLPLCEIANEWLGTKWDVNKMEFQIANLFEDNTEANTTINGLNSFLKIVEMVSSGKYPLDAAVNLVCDRFGKTPAEAKKLLGNIVVNPNIQNPPPTPIPSDV